MGTEIERKFLVCGEDWQHDVRRRVRIYQGYLSVEPDRTVRVRVEGDTALLTIKGRAKGLVRREFEYDIPVDDGRQMLEEFCKGETIEKTRHEVPFGDHLWEIDVFAGANRGLILAEVELDRADAEFERPQWVGDEVTGQVRYYNARLVEEPFQQWSENEQ